MTSEVLLLKALGTGGNGFHLITFRVCIAFISHYKGGASTIFHLLLASSVTGNSDARSRLGRSGPETGGQWQAPPGARAATLYLTCDLCTENFHGVLFFLLKSIL